MEQGLVFASRGEASRALEMCNVLRKDMFVVLFLLRLQHQGPLRLIIAVDKLAGILEKKVLQGAPGILF